MNEMLDVLLGKNRTDSVLPNGKEYNEVIIKKGRDDCCHVWDEKKWNEKKYGKEVTDFTFDNWFATYKYLYVCKKCGEERIVVHRGLV